MQKIRSNYININKTTCFHDVDHHENKLQLREKQINRNCVT